ncbi:hypothetical protein IGI04_040229 [Brassica rapa subsp. trilocularis]|uniref:Uncharacterized protein n=1 Tax=Brassica rapa subsp. trilocularis TaxID=1813537 RepID=A0ABQ7KN32_BRACM|nr:hypothetical protein IGI04_040229 [Brassica rapa subsp. trilocularis]
MKLRRDRHWKLSSFGFTATESLEIAARRRHGNWTCEEADRFLGFVSPATEILATSGHGGDAIIGFDLLSSKPLFMNPSECSNSYSSKLKAPKPVTCSSST